MAAVTGADILARDQWRCVRCGKFVLGDYSVHHRILGDRANMRAANLLTLCGSGTTGCHGWVHANPKQARADGYIVSKHTRVALELAPVLYHQPGREGWFVIDDDLNLAAA